MPYNPGIEYRGDRYLFTGIADAGREITTGIERYRQEKAESQAADAAYETLLQFGGPTLLKQVGQGANGGGGATLEDLGKFSGLSLSQKKAKLGQLGVMLSLAREQAQQDAAQTRHREEMGVRLGGLEVDRGRLLVDQAQQQAKQAQQAGLAREVSEYLGIPEGVRRPPDQALPEIAARHGAMDARWMQQLSEPKWTPEMMDLNGAQVVTTSPNSAQVLQPKATAPVAPNYEWVFSDDPAVFAQGVQALPPELIKDVLARRNAFNRAMGRDVDPLREAIGRLLGGGQRPPGAVPGGAPGAGPKVRRYNPATRQLED